MKTINIYLYIIASFLLLLSQTGCRKSYDPGDWSLLPEKVEPEKPEDPDDTKTKSIKVMSVNMRIGSPSDLPLAIKLIKDYDPDLVFLRQVDSATTRADKVDRVKAVAEEVGMESFFVKNFDYQTGGFGNAVLSKFSILEKTGVILDRVEGSNAELRSLAVIKVEVDVHNHLYFMGTELDPSVVENRNLQVREILDYSAEIKDPVIFVGNFNEQEGKGQVIDYFRGFFTFACLGTGCPLNAPKDNPNGVYDYITYKADDNRMSVSKYGPLAESANTFLPMTAEIALKLNDE